MSELASLINNHKKDVIMDQDYVSSEKRRILEGIILPIEKKPSKKLEASPEKNIESDKTMEDSPAPGEESAP